MSAKKKLMIIDGHALIHRSFHALPPTLTTKDGELVNAVYGFTTVLIKAIRELKPDYIALTMDKAAPTFRHTEYAEYKAHRVKAPDELYSQIPRVEEIARAFNIPIYEMEGFEADDLIGTISRTVDGEVEKIIVTGDLDTLQLINDHTKVYTMKRGLTDSMLYDVKAVKERYGLKPEQMVDYKALRGDPSDNIPGVKGIGEKTAVELLRGFKSLDGVYKYIDDRRSASASVSAVKEAKVMADKTKTSTKAAAGEAEKIKPRIAELLLQYRDDAYMSKSLAEIKCDVDIDFKLEGALFSDFDHEKAAKLFSELEFKSLLPRLQGLAAKELDKKSKKEQAEIAMDKFERNNKLFKYELVDTEDKFADFFKELKKEKEFAFDTETANFEPIDAELLGMSFSWKEGEAYYVQITNYKLQMTKNQSDLFSYQKGIREQELGIGNGNTNANTWIEKLKPILEDEMIKKYGHNIKYDIEVMRCYGVDIRGVAGDTMIASYLLNPGTRQHNLDGLSFTEFGHQKITKEDMLGKGKEKLEFKDIPLEKLYNYSCEDADFTFRLARKLLPELKKQKLDKLFAEIEMPLVKVLSEMERNGVKIDDEFLKKMSGKTVKKLEQLEEKVCGLAGKKFNISSTQQLREVLFSDLKISALNISKTKTGLSTAAEELEKIKDEHPVIRLIQEYRELTKLQTTYINALPKLINKNTGRLHTSFNQTITATGRLSSAEPNLQNIPIRTELGREVRKAFVADAGYKLVSLDYSQIELRLAAHMSGDEKMIKAFKEGADIHSLTAAEINQVPLAEVTKEMRREAKAVNFGVLYGQGPRGLAQGADIPYARAKEFIDKYFSVYRGVKNYIDETIAQAKEKGYTETMFGRVRYLPEINSSVLQVAKTAERMAINTPIQGTAADMIKMAMVKIDALINTDYKAASRKSALIPPYPPCERGLSAAKGGDPVKMLLQVHDELVFEIREDMIKEVVKKIINIMENAIKLKVPVIVDAKAGDNWGEMNKIL